METQILENLGLTQSEVKTYLTLLEIGSCTAGTVLEKSGLQNSVLHRALNSLIEKGLITYILEGRRKVYQATDPEYFYTHLDEKRRMFEELLPSLKQRQLASKTRETATIYKGKRGITEIYTALVRTTGKEYNTFGGGAPCVELMGESWWLNIHRKRIAEKLPSRQVFDDTVRKVGKNIAALPQSSVRFLAAEFAQFQETVIVGESVGICIFTQRPYGILIKDASVAEGYRKHFEVLWQAATP